MMSEANFLKNLMEMDVDGINAAQAWLVYSWPIGETIVNAYLLTSPLAVFLVKVLIKFTI